MLIDLIKVSVPLQFDLSARLSCSSKSETFRRSEELFCKFRKPNPQSSVFLQKFVNLKKLLGQARYSHLGPPDCQAYAMTKRPRRPSQVCFSDIQFSDSQISYVQISGVQISYVQISDSQISDVQFSDSQISDVQISDI